MKSKTAYLRVFYLVVLCLAVLSWPLKIAHAAVPAQALDEIEIWVKIVCYDKWYENITFKGPDDDYPDKPDGGYQKQDELKVTVEGTCKLKPRDEYYYYGPYPIEIDYDVVEQNFTITGQGGGNSYYFGYHQDCKWPPGGNRTCKYFLGEERQNWNYKITNNQYRESVVDLVIKQDDENALPHYKLGMGLSLWSTEFWDYLEASGTKHSTYSNFDGTWSENEELGYAFNNASYGHSFQSWEREKEGGAVEGDLSFDGAKFIDSGQIRYDGGSKEPEWAGSYVDISYKINRKPSVKEIQPNQVLGRYKYKSDHEFTPASLFVAGKDTVIQVFLPDDVKAEKQSKAELKVYRDGTCVATLTNFKKDEKNNALIFIPPNRASCGNWQAGKYKFVATVGDSEEFEKDYFFFTQRSKLNILAVPVKANYGGTIKTPANQWKTGGDFMRRVYPVAYNNFSYTQGSLFDASDASYDITTDAGQRKLWEGLNTLQSSPGQYDLIIGFIDVGIPLPGNRVLQGYTYGPPSNIVVNSDQDMPATVAHEVAHIYNVGDEYQGGSYNLSVNSPPLGYQGSDWNDDNIQVTATDPEVKSFPGAEGSLISEKLHPYDTGGRGLLEDAICFMGSGAAQSKNWISPSVWLQLYGSLAPTGATAAAALSPQGTQGATGVASSPDEVQGATGGTRVIEASGWVTKAGEVELSLPWSDYTTSLPVVTNSGTYTIQAVDEKGNVLGQNGFTPTFFVRTNPPRSIDQAPFTKVLVPFPAGTKKFQVVDQNKTVLKEVQVSSGTPTVTITAPASGQQVSGTQTITWTATDPDGDNLHYKVEYSPNGVDWQMLAFKLTDTSWVQDFSQLPGGQRSQIRVTASDGVNSSTATSGTFGVPLKGPEVFIEEPQNKASYTQNEGVVLRGWANDPQEGQIYDDNRLIWTSDRAGELGRGPTVFTTALGQGQHTITLTATNGAGMFSSQSINLNITAAPVEEPSTEIQLPDKTCDPVHFWKITFNQPVDAGTLQRGVRVLDAGNQPVSIMVVAVPGKDDKTAIIYPMAGTYQSGQTYTIYVDGGDQGVRSVAGQPLKASYKMNFRVN